ncbi:hypothetical protein LPJ70_000878 [Coemansia sp. RSA 2708]|nr:hypothetical protein LPJ70_000878 [Coemansia sp. RSA 2708]
MNRKSQPPTNAKTSSSSSKRHTPSYAQFAGSNPARSASPSASDKPNPSAAAPLTKPSFSAAAKQARQRTPDNASDSTNGSPAVNARGNGAQPQGRNAPVRLPNRNSVSSAGAPAIQFGSLNQQTRPSSPPAAAHRPSATAATSGGVPATIGKSTPKPNFGSIPNSAEDTGRRPSSRNNSDAPSSRHSHHGRQHQQQPQQQQQSHTQRPGSRSSGYGRQSQGHLPGRKDSSGYKQHSGAPKSNPKPQDAGNGEAAFHSHSEGGSYAGGQPATVQMPSGPPAAHPPGGMGAQQQQPPHYAGSPYRGQQHVRPPHNQSPNPYKPQSAAHYPPPHMGTQPMSQPMGYPMPAPGQPPIMTTQPNMQPMQGWMPPPHQFAYMPMGAPGYDQYYRSPQTGGGPPPHNMYGYSMPNPSHAGVSSQLGAGGIMPGPMGGAHMPGMTASPVPGQQPQHHGLSASAQAFVPGRRPVRIVNPNTNEEIDISQQRLRSASAASSTPQNVASGTASPAPSAAPDAGDQAAALGTPVAEEVKPKFKIPSARAIKIVNPNLVPKADAEETPAKPAAATDAVAEVAAPAEKAAEAAPAVEAAAADNSGPAPMEVDEKPEEKPLAEAAPETEKPAVAEEEPQTAEPVAAPPAEEPKEATSAVEAVEAVPPKAVAEEPVAVDELAESLAKTTIADTVAEPEAAAPAEAVVVDEPEKVEEDEETVRESRPVSKGSEDGEIADDKTKPPALSQSRSRQVTFSEPATPSLQVLQAQEVVDMYASDSSAPKIVGEILRYPRVFLERFNGLGKAPALFHFEITSTDDRWSSERGSGMRRSGSGRHRDSAASSGFGGMGNFRASHTHPALASSEERFKQSTMDMKGRPESGRGAMMGGRTASGHRGLGGNRESRGGRTGGRGGRGRGRGRGGSQASDRQAAEAAAALANAKPLEKSENRYIAKSLRNDKPAVEDDMDPEVYDRQIRVQLNKITPDNFDAVSDEVLVWGEKSSKETDGRILRHLITLVFQKATDEPVWAKMYAQLCHKMICQASSDVQDHNLLTKDGGFLSGGYLVRKYLLTKCQEEFERGWKVEIPKDMESAEYYEATKIKRRGLGLVQFIGELFLFDVLTLRIMHECVKRLLSNVETPDEAETESLAKLLTTVGKKLDDPSAKAYMDAYFARIQTMANNKYLSSRIRFMLADLIELRQKNWVMRMPDAGPKTIAEIHDDIERKKAADAALRRAPSHMGRRADSHAGRGEGGRRSGWNTVGGPSGSGRGDQSQRAGDLSKFGNLSRSKQQSVAGGLPSNPFGAFSGGSRGWRNGSSDGRKSREDPSRSTGLGAGGRTPSHSSRAESSAATPEPVGSRNMFDALMNEDDEAHASSRADAGKDTSRGSSSSGKPAAAAKPLDSAVVQRKVRGLFDEYMQLNMDTELIECFKELGAVNFQPAMYETANYIVDRREDQATKIAQGVAVLRADGVLTEDTAVGGLAEYSEQLEDMALDAPGAYKFFGMLMVAAKVPLTRMSEALGELAVKVSSPRPPALNVVFAYIKQMIKDDGEEQTRAAIDKAGFDVSKYMNPERRSDADVKKALDFQDLLGVFSKYA